MMVFEDQAGKRIFPEGGTPVSSGNDRAKSSVLVILRRIGPYCSHSTGDNA
jgi:hypothetical protein